MIRSLVVVVIAACAHAPAPPAPAPAAPATAIPLDQARAMFAEAEALCRADGGALWGASLCAPIMFVDRASRLAVANRAAPPLRSRDGVFVGTLPAEQTIANTSVEWAGERWVQMVWPLPEDREARAILIMHEHFHRLRPAATREGDCAHLDELDGRYLLQLEWRALAAALTSADGRALGDALAFRAARRRAFPGGAACEDALELNEGLAEYTGVVAGASTADARTAAALRDLRAHVGDPSFVRSFAYATGPAYGLMLDRTAPGWRARVADAGSLTALLPAPPGAGDADAYDGRALRASETARAERRAAELARYRRLLVEGPVLVLPLAHMKIEFDPRALLPLGALGTVYPTLRIVDDWGVLEVTGGALLAADWQSVAVPAPEAPNVRAVPEQWKLELAAGWELAPAARAGDYRAARP
jgi:hypothetical protein